MQKIRTIIALVSITAMHSSTAMHYQPAYAPQSFYYQNHTVQHLPPCYEPSSLIFHPSPSASGYHTPVNQPACVPQQHNIPHHLHDYIRMQISSPMRAAHGLPTQQPQNQHQATVTPQQPQRPAENLRTQSAVFAAPSAPNPVRRMASAMAFQRLTPGSSTLQPRGLGTPVIETYSYLDKKYEIKKDPLSQGTIIDVKNAQGECATIRIPHGVEVTEKYAQKALEHEQELSEKYPGVEWRFVMCTLSAEGNFCKTNCYSNKLIHFVGTDGLGDFVEIPHDADVTKENVRSIIEDAGKQVFTFPQQSQQTKE